MRTPSAVPSTIATLLGVGLSCLVAALCSCTATEATCPDAAPRFDSTADSRGPLEARTPDQGPLASRMIELKSFGEVLAAHDAGRQLRVLFKYQECKLNGGAGLKAMGGIYAVAVEHVAQSASVPSALITFSDSKLVIDPQVYPPQKDAHVYNTARVRLSADGSVKVATQYLEYATSKINMSEVWDCNLGTGKGAYFFVENAATAPAEPQLLKSYVEVFAAVAAGRPVTATVDLTRCQKDATSGTDAASDPKTISMAVATFEWFDIPSSGLSDRIVWSESHLMLDPRDPVPPAYVHRYFKISLRAATGDAQVTRQYIDLATGAAKLHQVYACKLDGGDGVGGLRMVRR